MTYENENVLVSPRREAGARASTGGCWPSDSQQFLVCYQFGDWRFEPHSNQLRRGGQVQQLEYRCAEVLRCLLRQAGQIVSASSILSAVWAGRVVEPNAIHRNLSIIRRHLGDDPRNPAYIETISKRGYRTIAAVEALPAMAKPGHTPGKRKAPWIAATLRRQGIQTGLSPSNSLAVLPLNNLGPEDSHTYFAAGVQEEIVDRVVAVGKLSVVAPGATTTCAKQEGSSQQSATELGVALVLVGSVRCEQGRVRMAFRLLHGHSGLHLWSQTFEVSVAEGFAKQDEIAAHIVQQLHANHRRPNTQLIGWPGAG